MALTRRSAKRTLKYQLSSEPYRFTFVQSVRLLERICERQEPPRKAVGFDTAPELESVRFCVPASRSFPPTEVVSLTDFDHELSKEKGKESRETAPDVAQQEQQTDLAAAVELAAKLDSPAIPKLTVAFMGLFGPSGVLPQHDTQRIIDSGTKKNPERDFLDVFNHRILSLYYRASIKYRIPFTFEASYRKNNPAKLRVDDSELEDAEECDLVTRSLYSLAGMGTAGLRRRLEIPNELSIEFNGLFGHQPKNALSLQRMLDAYFALPFEVIQFVGQWMNLSTDNVSEMPSTESPLGQNCALGRTYILGQRVWDVAGKFRLKIGPLDRATFESFLPGSRNLVEVAQIAQLYAGNQFDFDVQLELLAAEVPAMTLSGDSRLGLNTWLFSKQPTDNKFEAVFSQSGLPQENEIAA